MSLKALLLAPPSLFFLVPTLFCFSFNCVVEPSNPNENFLGQTLIGIKRKTFHLPINIKKKLLPLNYFVVCKTGVMPRIYYADRQVVKRSPDLMQFSSSNKIESLVIASCSCFNFERALKAFLRH